MVSSEMNRMMPQWSHIAPVQQTWTQQQHSSFQEIFLVWRSHETARLSFIIWSRMEFIDQKTPNSTIIHFSFWSILRFIWNIVESTKARNLDMSLVFLSGWLEGLKSHVRLPVPGGSSCLNKSLNWFIYVTLTLQVSSGDSFNWKTVKMLHFIEKKSSLVEREGFALGTNNKTIDNNWCFTVFSVITSCCWAVELVIVVNILSTHK